MTSSSAAKETRIDCSVARAATRAKAVAAATGPLAAVATIALSVDQGMRSCSVGEGRTLFPVAPGAIPSRAVVVTIV